MFDFRWTILSKYIYIYIYTYIYIYSRQLIWRWKYTRGKIYILEKKKKRRVGIRYPDEPLRWNYSRLVPDSLSNYRYDICIYIQGDPTKKKQNPYYFYKNIWVLFFFGGGHPVCIIHAIFIFIVKLTTFRLICPLPFFRFFMSNTEVHTEPHTRLFNFIHGDWLFQFG